MVVLLSGMLSIFKHDQNAFELSKRINMLRLPSFTEYEYFWYIYMLEFSSIFFLKTTNLELHIAPTKDRVSGQQHNTVVILQSVTHKT